MQTNQGLKFSLILAFVALLTSTGAQVRHTQGQFLGKSSALSTWKFVAAKFEKTQKKKKDWKVDAKAIPNFKNHTGFPTEPNKNIFPRGVDKSVQKDILKYNTVGVEILQDYNGIDHLDSKIWPPDCNGDIGLQYYVMTANGSNGTIIHVYDKVTGALVEETFMGPLWAELGALGAGDPIVWFDRFVNRWFLTEFTYSNSMLVAVSESSDPLGSYNAYEFVAPAFPDYPHFGSWDDGVYITTNEYNGFNPVYAIDRDAMVNGDETATFIEFDAMTKFGAGDFFQVSSPVDFSGTIPPKASTNFMAIRIADDQWDGVVQDMIQYYEFAADFINPANSTIEGPYDLLTKPFKSDLCNGGLFNCVEMSNGALLSVIPTVIMNKVQYRNFGDYESILLNFAVDITGDNEAGIRWFELRKTDEEAWSIYQESTFSLNDGDSRFMGSMSQDSEGNILMGYAIVSTETDPSVGVTGRLVSDPINAMSFGERIIVEGQKPSPIFRWGDYFSMTVDPQNDANFWLTSEYMPSNQDWSTRLTEMRIKRDTIDAQVSELLSPKSGGNLSLNESVKIKITNPGYSPIEDVAWTVIFEGEELESGIFEDVILPSNSVDITLTNTVDVSAIDSYSFIVFVELQGDEDNSNDTLIKTLMHIPSLDLLAINAHENLGGTCDGVIDVHAKFVNNGVNLVTSYDVNLFVDEALVETKSVSTSLQMNQKEEIIFSDVSLSGQYTTVRYEAVNINGVEDQFPDNNSYIQIVEWLTIGKNTNLSFETDSYPAEVSWQIFDESGTVVYEGGDYSGNIATENIELCLREDCYSFQLNDLAGDGWSEGNDDNKFLELKNFDGNILLSLEDFSFGETWTVDFCVSNSCDIQPEIEYQESSGPGIADGTIMINLSDFLDGATYSIDGGANYQESPLFTDLLGGQYDIVVIDGRNCLFEKTIAVVVAVNDLEDAVTFTVNPNPSFGMLKIHIAGYDGPFEMNMRVVDQAGRSVSSHRITKFSDGYRASLLMPNLPSGLYFVSVQSDEINLLRKFVKQ